MVDRYPSGAYTKEYLLGIDSASGIGGQKLELTNGEDMAISYGPGVNPNNLRCRLLLMEDKNNGAPVSPNERIDQAPITIDGKNTSSGEYVRR